MKKKIQFPLFLFLSCLIFNGCSNNNADSASLEPVSSVSSSDTIENNKDNKTDSSSTDYVLSEETDIPEEYLIKEDAATYNRWGEDHEKFAISGLIENNTSFSEEELSADTETLKEKCREDIKYIIEGYKDENYIQNVQYFMPQDTRFYTTDIMDIITNTPSSFDWQEVDFTVNDTKIEWLTYKEGNLPSDNTHYLLARLCMRSDVTGSTSYLEEGDYTLMTIAFYVKPDNEDWAFTSIEDYIWVCDKDDGVFECRVGDPERYPLGIAENGFYDTLQMNEPAPPSADESEEYTEIEMEPVTGFY